VQCSRPEGTATAAQKRESADLYNLVMNEGSKSKNNIVINTMDFISFYLCRDAETLLEGQPTGNFLVRVGETRLGYTLSFKDESRCRHYMIEYLSSEESFQVVGEGTQHISLLDLIHFYKKVCSNVYCNIIIYL